MGNESVIDAKESTMSVTIEQSVSRSAVALERFGDLGC
jgi:hypothetical protein